MKEVCLWVIFTNELQHDSNFFKTFRYNSDVPFPKSMAKNRTPNLKSLFYASYCDILDVYKKNHPEHGFTTTQRYESLEQKGSLSSSPIIYLRSLSYYVQHIEEIQALNSFKKIVEFIKNSPDILAADGVVSDSPHKDNIGKKLHEAIGIENSFGGSIYLIAQEILRIRIIRPYKQTGILSRLKLPA